MKKQSFTILLEDGRVLGCSFKRGKYTSTYFGWITEYESIVAYEKPQLAKGWKDYKNIALAITIDESIIELKKYIENSIIVSGGYRII